MLGISTTFDEELTSRSRLRDTRVEHQRPVIDTTSMSLRASASVGVPGRSDSAVDSGSASQAKWLGTKP